MNSFDAWLGGFIKKLSVDDALIVVADHGCDPGFDKSTDHTREYVPYIEYSKSAIPKNYGTLEGFGFVSDRVFDLLEIK